MPKREQAPKTVDISEESGETPLQVDLKATTMVDHKVYFAGTAFCRDEDEAAAVEEQHAKVLADDRGGLVNYEAIRKGVAVEDLRAADDEGDEEDGDEEDGAEKVEE